jgi:flagellar hook-associated protein 3 FlgL
MFNTISTATNEFLANLSNLEQRIFNAQQQVASGLSMVNVSDDPDHVSELLQVKANIAANDQMKTNLTTVQSELGAASSAIESATTLMNSALQIATQATGSTSTDTTRTQLATQVQNIITQMYGIANTQFEGRYVFSGDDDQQQPYTGTVLGASSGATGVGTYQGSSTDRTVASPDGPNMTISLTAQTIFDGGSGSNASTSVFQSLTALYNDLSNNNVSNLSTDLSNIQTASNYLDAQQAQYGDFQDQVSNALTYQGDLDTQYQSQMSSLQDADIVSASTTLQQDETEEQAALQAQASLPTKTLFDYLG